MGRAYTLGTAATARTVQTTQHHGDGGLASIMESLPWPAITAASGGWVLFAALSWLVLRKLISGDLVTRREHDEALNALAVKDTQIAEKDKQLGTFGAGLATVEQFTRGLQQEMKHR